MIVQYLRRSRGQGKGWLELETLDYWVGGFGRAEEKKAATKEAGTVSTH